MYCIGIENMKFDDSILAFHILVVTPLALLAPIVFVCRRKWKYPALNVEEGQTFCQLFRTHFLGEGPWVRRSCLI